MENSKKNINFEAVEQKYDPQLSFRKIGPKISIVITTLLVSMSIYHFWASGFGLVREVLHRGIANLRNTDKVAAECVVRAGHDNDIQTSLPQAINLHYCSPIEKTAQIYSQTVNPPATQRQGPLRFLASEIERAIDKDASREMLVLFRNYISGTWSLFRTQRLKAVSFLQIKMPQKLQDETKSPQGEVDQSVPRFARKRSHARLGFRVRATAQSPATIRS